MKRALLTRRDASDQGSFGTLECETLRLFSGELPDRNNAPSISCIPLGKYLVVWTLSPRFRRFMYEVLSVRSRSGIRKHAANFMGDTSLGLYSQLNGCIALGEKLGWMDGQKALLVSAPAMRRFETFMNKQPFELEIVNA